MRRQIAAACLLQYIFVGEREEMRSGGAAALPFHGASSARRIFPVLFLAAASRGTTGRDWRRHADTIPRPRARRHFHNIQMYKSAGPIPRPLQEDEGDGGSARGGKKIHRYERDVGGRREKERRCEKGARKREKNATKSAKRKEEMSGERERARSERTRGCASEGGREDRRSTKWRRGIGRCGAGTRRGMPWGLSAWPCRGIPGFGEGSGRSSARCATPWCCRLTYLSAVVPPATGSAASVQSGVLPICIPDSPPGQSNDSPVYPVLALSRSSPPRRSSFSPSLLPFFQRAFDLLSFSHPARAFRLTAARYHDSRCNVAKADVGIVLSDVDQRGPAGEMTY